MATTHPFLSDEWIQAAKQIRQEFEGQGAATPHVIKMNLVITDVPFGDGTIDAHMDSTSGEIELDLGHMQGEDLTVTVDYETAKAIFVDQNQQAGMQAFMSGKIKVQGDMTKMMAMQTAQPDPTQVEISKRIAAITE